MATDLNGLSRFFFLIMSNILTSEADSFLLEYYTFGPALYFLRQGPSELSRRSTTATYSHLISSFPIPRSPSCIMHYLAPSLLFNYHHDHHCEYKCFYTSSSYYLCTYLCTSTYIYIYCTL